MNTAFNPRKTKEFSQPIHHVQNGTVRHFTEQKLLLVSEQGLGDTLQFMRYAIALKRQGTDISLCAPEKLHTLIQASGIDPSPLNQEQGNQATEGSGYPFYQYPGI